MKNKNHVLNNVWNNYPEAMSNAQHINLPTVERLINEMFSVGELYYYSLNFSDSSLASCHKNILDIHGFKDYPQHLNEILELIHPDDISFVIAAETASMEKVKEIGFSHHVNLKSSYCFRMKTAGGSYQLFHHQSLHIKQDEEGRLIQTVNIHTNIHHITTENSYVVTVMGIGGQSDFHQIDLKPQVNKIKLSPKGISKREIEVLRLVAQGYSSTEISEFLFLSSFTVRTHRKNILKKTGTKNASELVRNCIEWGYL